MRGAFRALWKSLTNTVSGVDLAGVFAVSIPSTNANETLSQDLFQDFFKAYARLKYPLGSDFSEKMLDEIRHIKGSKPQPDNGALSAIADKNAIRVLLKYDLPLRRAFSTFCAQAIRVGSSVSWDEVKSLSLGMEVCQCLNVLLIDVADVSCLFVVCYGVSSWTAFCHFAERITSFHRIYQRRSVKYSSEKQSVATC